MQLVFREIRRDTEKSIHGALSIGRDHHQTFPRHTFSIGTHLVQTRDHARRVQIIHVKLTRFVIRDFARIKRFTTKLTHRHNGIRSRTATGALFQAKGLLHIVQQAQLCRLINQRHHAFGNALRCQKIVGHFKLFVHQGITDTEHIIFHFLLSLTLVDIYQLNNTAHRPL